MAAVSCCQCSFALSSPSQHILSQSPCGSSLAFKLTASPVRRLRFLPRVISAEAGKTAEKAPAGVKSKSKNSVDRNAPVKQSLVERTDDAMPWREYRQKMEGDEPDFWEGPGWNAFGFFLEYLWAFGIVFAAGASLYAVRSYNDGAADFKATETFRAAIESSVEPTPSSQPSGEFPLDDAPPL